MANTTKMLTLRQQVMFTRNLGALLGSGLSLDVSLSQLGRLLPAQSVKLEGMAADVRRGISLSKVCEGLLPDELVAAIAVGEQSGGMDKVMFEIRDTLVMKERIKKTASSMYKPLFMLLMGLVVFIGFMVGVIPTLSATSEKLQPPGRAVEHNALMQMMVTLSEFLRASGPALGVFILLVSVALFFYGRTPAGRLVLYGMLVKVPLLGGAVVAINFALWARYMALMWRAGYADIAKAVAITKRAMPEVFHEGLDLYSEDLARGKGLGASCDPERLAPNDPRLQWPMFLQVALQISEKTMETDTQLTTASAYLEEDAELLINRLIEVAKIMALVLVACSAALPIIGYMFEVVTMVSNTLSRGIR